MFYEEIQYHMEEKTYAQGEEIIYLKQKCSEITFIIEGDIDIEIHNQDGESCQLDVLKKGDVIGQYSILQERGFLFSATALEKVRTFTLSKQFFLEYQNKIEGLCNALTFANDLVVEDGVPIQDYRIHQYNINHNQKFKSTKKYKLGEKIKERFLYDIEIQRQEEEIKPYYGLGLTYHQRLRAHSPLKIENEPADDKESIEHDIQPGDPHGSQCSPDNSDEESEIKVINQPGLSSVEILRKIKEELEKQKSKNMQLFEKNKNLQLGI